MTKQNQSSSNHVYIVDIAILNNIKAILCLHRLPYIMLTSLTYIVDIAINVVQHRDDIESTSYSFFLVYVHRQRIVDRYRVDIVSTSYLFFLVYVHRRHRTSDRYRVDIMSTSYPFFLVNIVDIRILINTESTSFLHRAPSYLFTSSTLQCCQTSSRHCTMIDNQSRSYQHCVNLFHLMYIVDIAMLAIVKSTLRFAFCEW